MDCLWTVRSAHVKDAVGIDVVGYFNLRHISWRSWDALQWNCRRLLSLVVVPRPRKLDERSWLVVRIGRQGLNLLVRMLVLCSMSLVITPPAILQTHGHMSHVS